MVNPFVREPSLRMALLAAAMAFLGSACSPTTDGPGEKIWDCALAPGSPPESVPALGCAEDYQALAARPLEANIPGAFAVKTVIDRADGDRAYFLDTRKYGLHYGFVSTHLSGNGKPVVLPAIDFNRTEYYSPDRRFILGTLARYEGPGIWAWELTPADNAGADMIAFAYAKIAEACFCGKDLYFHANSLTLEAEARKLPASVKVITGDRLGAGTGFQPLSYATGIGRLVFASAGAPEADRAGGGDIVVLDTVPDGLPAAAGIITQGFQAPLAPLNLLARERGIPNLGLRGAFGDSALRALEGKWVRLVVDAFGYSAAEATQAEAEAWREAHRPAAVPVPPVDANVRDLRDAERILDLESLGLADALKQAIPAFGGIASHFSALSRMDSAKVGYAKSFVIPAYYCRQHMRNNGLADTLDRMLADSAFRSDARERERRLASLRAAILAAPLDSAFSALLEAKLDGTFPGGARFLFLPSSNAEGLDGFAGAGLYEARIGDRSDPAASMRAAVLGVWAGLWGAQAFAERDLHGIDHGSIGMAVMVQAAGEAADAEGQALTANPFDPPGYEPGFYVDVRAGEAPLTRPESPGAMDRFVYHYTLPGQPIVPIARADPSPAGAPVLSGPQIYALGNALWEIHNYFWPAYGNLPAAWYAMGVDFKLVRPAGSPPGTAPALIVKRAIPLRGWGRW